MASNVSSSKLSGVVTKRIYFIRHGQSEANKRKTDTLMERDAMLTELGRLQASAWQKPGALDSVYQENASGNIVSSGKPEICICSPLRRAMETACLVFKNDASIHIECSKYAREKWWTLYQCVGSSHDETLRFASGLCKNVRGLDALTLVDEYWDPEAELKEAERMKDKDAGANWELKRSVREKRSDYLSELIDFLINHEAKVLAVACHWGVINHLTGASPNNCDVIVADLSAESRLFSLLNQHAPPGDVAKSN